MSYASMWMGPAQAEGTAAFHRAKEAGFTTKRAIVLGNVGSFRDCYAFRRSIARHAGCSIRTVARTFAQAKPIGFMGTARGKKDEVPPGAKGPLPCGWSHRWTNGWGGTGPEIKAAVQQATATFEARKLRRIAAKVGTQQNTASVNRQRVARSVAAATPYTGRRMTAAEIDEALALIPERPPDK